MKTELELTTTRRPLTQAPKHPIQVNVRVYPQTLALICRAAAQITKERGSLRVSNAEAMHIMATAWVKNERSNL